MSQFADYSAVDPTLNEWGLRNGLRWASCYKGYEVRSFSWPLAGTESMQIWVDEPTGNLVCVNVALNSSSDARRKVKKAECSLETAEAGLDDALCVAREWQGEMRKVENLHAVIDGKLILRGLSLTVSVGEVQAIMGPNGAGKPTLGGAERRR